MSKIFGIGLMKTGTTSLYMAMKILGYSSIHYSDNPDYDIHYNDFMCDMPMQTRFDKYDQRYPGSKFILLIRNADEWLASCEKWIDNHPSQRGSVTSRYRIEQFGIDIFDLEKYKLAYYTHHEKIKNYFANRQQDLLTLNICSEPSWDTLCNYLNRDIPNLPFPHQNKRL